MRTKTTALWRATAVALAVAVMLPAAPVPADAGTKPISGIPGRSGGGGSPGGTGATQCVDGAGKLNGEFIYISPWSGCKQYGSSAFTGVGGVWFEVWRFYGTAKNPTQSWTVSRLNQPVWDDPSDMYAVFAPHPDDAAGVKSTPKGPWEAYTSNAGGGARIFNASGSQRKSPGKVVHTGLTYNGRRAISTDTPFRRSGSCTGVETNDKMVADFFDRSHPDFNDQASKDFRKHFFDNFKKVQAANGTAAALSTINARGSWKNGTGKAPVNPDDIRYDDGIACSSGFDFVVKKDTAPKQLTTCWMPVEARYIMKIRPSGERVRDFTVAGGPRYHTETYPFRAKNDPYWTVRKAIYDEVRSRPADVLTPAQPYVDFGPKWQPSRNATAAAKTARDHVQCTHGTGSVFTETMSGSAKGATPDRVEIKFTAGPASFVRVGGELAPAAWTAASGKLQCNGKACKGSLAPELVSLSYTLRITGTNGYSPCKNGQLSCDFTVEMGKPSTRKTAPAMGPGGTVTSSVSGTGYFYRATSGSQRVKVEIVDAKGTYRAYREVEHSSGACNTAIFTLWDGNGSGGVAPEPCRTWTEKTASTHTLPLTVAKPRTLRVTSGVGQR